MAAFSAAGAVGTVAGAMFADRVGGRHLLVRSLPVATPLAAVALLTEGAVSTIAFALVGFVLLSSFSVTVMMGQEYLPGRLALAAGLMIGFGAIGSAAPGLALFGVIADTAGPRGRPVVHRRAARAGGRPRPAAPRAPAPPGRRPDGRKGPPQGDLFGEVVESRLQRSRPLAARMRPEGLDDVVGQPALLGRRRGPARRRSRATASPR